MYYYMQFTFRLYLLVFILDILLRKRYVKALKGESWVHTGPVFQMYAHEAFYYERNKGTSHHLLAVAGVPFNMSHCMRFSQVLG